MNETGPIVQICGSLSSFTVGSLTCSSGWQTPTERGEQIAQELTNSERTRGAGFFST